MGMIGSKLKNLNKHIISDGFEFDIETFRGKCLIQGYWIAAMTSISECLRAKAENEDVNKKGDVICDLYEKVRMRAYHLYNAQTPYFFKGYTPEVNLDWSGVEFVPDDPIYQQIDVGVDGYQSTSETVFRNKSLTYQFHKLKAKRQTSSIFESSLTEGFTIGSKIGVTLPLPVNFELTANYTLNRDYGNRDEKKFTTYVEDVIEIPRRSTIKVSTVLKEKEIEYKFNTRVKVKGAVKVTFNKQSGLIVGEYNIPMETLIREEFPERMFEEVNGIFYIKIAGKCKFKCETDEIIISRPKSFGFWMWSTD